MPTSLEAVSATAAPEALAPKFKKLDIVGIPCEVGDGFFSDEKFISFDSLDGKIAGVAQTLDLRQAGDQWQVRAIVDSEHEDHLYVWVWGDFVQTAGFVKLPLGFAVPA